MPALPARVRAPRVRTAAALVAAATVAGSAVLGSVALAPAAAAATPIVPPPVVTPAATTTTLVSRSGTAVAAGAKLRLVVRVSPAVAGKATLRDGSKVVGTYKLTDGRVKVVVVPGKGNHSYAATFAPKYPDRYAPSASARVAVVAGAARALPLGKGAFGPLVLKTQRLLNWAGIPVKVTGTYGKATVTAVTRLQGKFFLSQTGVVNTRTMAQLQSIKLKRLPRACRDVGKAICIDKTRKVAQLVVNGKVTLSLDARFGSVRSEGLATREGIFAIQRKDADHVSSLYHTPMPYSMFFSGGQAVHYSKYFAADGYYGASHGCVNIRDYKGVAKMYARSPIGTRVVIYRS